NRRYTPPGPPPGSAIAGWDLGSELLGRPGCAPGPDGVNRRYTPPGPPPGSAIAGWDLGSELLGRPGCAPG
ncbi:hypothetical protein GR254_25115, partial [Mycobacterium tuberculosis]|nr:hypothetical protein [Mycobacterium tuberculosis]